MNLISRSTSGKREYFGQMDILLVVLGKAQAMTQFKSTSRTKVKRSHSCAQLKTDHFSGSKKIKCINDIDKDETESVIEKRPEEPNYYKIILKTNSPIFLKPVADLEKDRFSLFGNIDKEWKDVAFLLKRELQEMLNY